MPGYGLHNVTGSWRERDMRLAHPRDNFSEVPRDGCAMVLAPMLKRFGNLGRFGDFCRTCPKPHVVAGCVGPVKRARQDSNL
jgi:hypothetical protein